MYYIFMLAGLALLAIFFVTQIALPMIKGEALFPLFSKSNKLAREAEIALSEIDVQKKLKNTVDAVKDRAEDLAEEVTESISDTLADAKKKITKIT